MSAAQDKRKDVIVNQDLYAAHFVPYFAARRACP
jgi:hypothetical protein